jgi:endonuclease-3
MKKTLPARRAKQKAAATKRVKRSPPSGAPVTKSLTKPPKAIQQRATGVYQELTRLYPDAHCALSHRNAFELLIATILSAQCTDARVNMVTPALFKRYPTPAAMAKAPLGDIEQAVRTTGFFRSKAKSLQGTSRLLIDHHRGKVPQTMEELTALPGVARKTANVVLGNAFGIAVGVVVDTHIGRLSRRLSLTDHQDPKKVEQDLMALFPSDQWTMLAHLLISHGRAVCGARKPQCDRCTLAKICPKIGVEPKP